MNTNIQRGFPICISEPLKTMKNVFYFIFISFPRYLNFCLDFLVMQETPFNQKDEMNFKIYDVTTIYDVPKLCGTFTLPQNFHTMKLGQITVFFVVYVMNILESFQKDIHRSKVKSKMCIFPGTSEKF